MLAYFGSKLATYKTDNLNKHGTLMKFKKINKVLHPQLKLHQRSSDDLEK